MEKLPTTPKQSLPKLTKSEPRSFGQLTKDGRAQDLKEYIIDKAEYFIELNFPSTKNPKLIAAEFATDLTQYEKNCTPQDIPQFFNFIKKNPQVINELKILGNIITPIRLLDLFKTYKTEKTVFTNPQQLPEQRAAEPQKISQIVKKTIQDIRNANFVPPQYPPKVNHENWWYNPISNEKDYTEFKEAVKKMSKQDKNLWKKELESVIFEPESEREKRRIELLKLLQ